MSVRLHLPRHVPTSLCYLLNSLLLRSSFQNKSQLLEFASCSPHAQGEFPVRENFIYDITIRRADTL